MLYIRRHNRKLFRNFRTFSFVVVLCLPLLGLTSGVYVKGMYAQGRVVPVTHTTHGTEIPLARAASPYRQCCVTARHTTYLKQKNFLGKTALKRPVSLRTPPCCVALATTHLPPHTTHPSNIASHTLPH